MTKQEVIGICRPVVENLLDKLRLLPEDSPVLDQPLWSGHYEKDGADVDETGFTPRQLAAHSIVACYEVPDALLNGHGFDGVRAAFAELSTKAPSELVAALEARLVKLDALFAELTDEDLAEVVQTPLGERRAGDLLCFVALHVMHHKGQLMTSLRTMGVRPGRFF